jgi:ABC-type spermidine/putrescine transport system permease subunit II
MTKSKVVAIFISLLTGYAAARYAFRITSLINPDRLVSFTIQDVIYATLLVIILSFFGIILVSRFRIRQAIGWFLLFSL